MQSHGALHEVRAGVQEERSGDCSRCKDSKNAECLRVNGSFARFRQALWCHIGVSSVAFALGFDRIGLDNLAPRVYSARCCCM